MPNLYETIEAARGEVKIDLLIKNAKVINVLSGEIYETDVAVHHGIIAGFGAYDAEIVIDLKRQYLCPGLIDAHVHIESSMVTLPEFAKAVLPLGITTVISDLHEIANVLGLDGIRYMLQSSRNVPLNFYVMCPSCVPATDLETAGSELTAKDLEYIIKDERVLGLGEMMNYPGIIHRDPRCLDKIKIAETKIIDGHAPLVKGKDLSAYIAAGIYSDHECTSLEEAREKLRSGMYIFIREGTSAQNLEVLLPLLNPCNSRRFLFCVDDRNPHDLLQGKEISEMIRRAISWGMDPITAIQIASLNAADYFGLKELGAIAIGRKADFVVLKDLNKFQITDVFKDGRRIVEKGKVTEEILYPSRIPLRGTVNINWLEMKDLVIPAEKGLMKVIELIENQIITRKKLVKPTVENGVVVPDEKADILKIVVVERHTANGNMGLGFVKGFNLKKGAIASSVSHDSHNIVVVGSSDKDMITALIEISRMQGGQVVVQDGNILEALPLSIAGLMSRESLEFVDKKMRSLHKAARALGCKLEDPFMTMTFMALPVIPEIKLTDKGLVDVTKFEVVPLFNE